MSCVDLARIAACNEAPGDAGRGRADLTAGAGCPHSRLPVKLRQLLGLLQRCDCINAPEASALRCRSTARASISNAATAAAAARRNTEKRA